MYFIEYTCLATFILASIVLTNAQSAVDNFNEVTIASDVLETEQEIGFPGQYKVNLTKLCSKTGFCHYRLDFPLTGINGSEARQPVSERLFDKNAGLEKIQTSLQDQLLLAQKNTAQLTEVASKLKYIEIQINKSAEESLNDSGIQSTSVPMSLLDFEGSSGRNERLTVIEARIKSVNDLNIAKNPRQQNDDVTKSTSAEDDLSKIQRVVDSVEQSQFEIGNRLSNLEEAILSVLRGLDAKISAKIESVAGACNKCPTKENAKSPKETETQLRTEEIGETAEEVTREEGPPMMLCKTCCEPVSFSEYMQSRDLSMSPEEDTREDMIGSYNAVRYGVEAATGVKEVLTVEQRYFDEPLENVPESTVTTQIEETPVSSTTQNGGQLNQKNPVKTSSESGLVSTTSSTLIHDITLPQSNDSYELRESSGRYPGSAEYDVTTQTTTKLEISTTQSTTTSEGLADAPNTDIPYDCAELYLNGETQSGVYKIKPKKRGVWTVYCDMETSGGGWTTIQKRVNGDVNFTRNWKEYKTGFGNVDGDYWMGLEKMHHLSVSNRSRRLVLRIDLIDWNDVRHYAEYEVFRVRSESRQYQLIAKKYRGTAGDALNYGKNYNHHLQSFTTYDRDNDHYDWGNCGRYYRSGWWFNACFAANLNGQYYTGQYSGVQKGIYWGTWYRLTDPLTNARYSFKYVDMKVRPVSFSKISKRSIR